MRLFLFMELPGRGIRERSRLLGQELRPAPEALDVEAMGHGRAPMLPRDCCAHPEGAERLDPEQLAIVWFEEGDAAALLYRDEIVSVIPGWAGSSTDEHSYPGYARTASESRTCASAGNAGFQRIVPAHRDRQ